METHIKLMEGWLQHKHTQDKWTQYWCVLKEYVIYIFKTQETSRDNHIGVLQIGSDTTVKIGESDQKKGYRFDLYTTKKLNKFKTTKNIERELWKAYVVGLAEGDITDNYDLLPDQIKKVRDDIHRVISRSTRPPLPITSRHSYHDNTSVGTGFHSPTNSVSSIFGDNQSMMDNGGPITRHKFWPQRERSEVPSWFFASITRDFAENILSTGRNFGNTLMRESITFRDTGSYVITKKMEHSRGPPFNHFEVIRVAEGFKINVENAHKSISCLSDVMEYFVSMSGSIVTRPLVTNDLKVLGLDTPGYDTKIWKSKTNAESGEEDADFPPEAYEEPVMDSPPPRGASSKTWGPSNRQARESRQSRGGRTMSSGPGVRSEASPDSIGHRFAAAHAVNHLDSILSGSTSGQAGHKSPAQNTGRIYANDAAIIPISSGPGLVKPSHIPPQVHPKPPKKTEEGQTMTALQKQLSAVTLRCTSREEKPSVFNRNTWHHRQQLSTRSVSSSAVPTEEVYQNLDETALTRNLRSYSESDTPDDCYYDDAVALPYTGVTFNLGPTEAPDTGVEVEKDKTGGMKKDDFKKHLESLMKGGGGLKMTPKLGPRSPSQQQQQPQSSPHPLSQSSNRPLPLAPVQPQPTEQQEEQYDEVIYEDPDSVRQPDHR